MLGLAPVHQRQSVKSATSDKYFKAFEDGASKTTLEVSQVVKSSPAVTHNTLTRMKNAGLVKHDGYQIGPRGGPVTLWKWAN
jgi:predicted transcriptional regulator